MAWAQFKTQESPLGSLLPCDNREEVLLSIFKQKSETEAQLLLKVKDLEEQLREMTE
eukprot:CAMPEP_0168343330 /NCGR_PEP_ID=MMETSP0213-20121227/16012_1 /TAXON_ID=151035 /ORGANISM="Euplotes harpa, Strain FSP1.4" /LENGTH=56 /DNA_ID=CAMNT_0008350571 /DNA_START=267 /DNA_END=437 /DNA_ORIENTATION=+